MADEAGIGSVSLASLAARLGVKPPALYKHVASLGDLRHRIATLAMTELGEMLRDALQGRAGSEALAALFGAMRRYVAEHPGRYSATVGAEFQGQDDPLLAASARVIGSVGAVLSGYGVAPGETDHAIRALRCVIHGFAMLRATNAFQWSNDPDESFAWMIRFADAGLRGMGGQRAGDM
jgi:AcrR family transcriptional regulator